MPAQIASGERAREDSLPMNFSNQGPGPKGAAMTQKISQIELARELGINPRHARKLIKLGMPAHSAAAARAWRKRNIDDGSDETIAQLRGRLIARRLELVEIEVAEKRRGLVDGEDVRRLWLHYNAISRSRWLATPRLMQRDFPEVDPRIWKRLEEHIHGSLALSYWDAVSELGGRLAGDPESSETKDEVARAKREGRLPRETS